MVSTLSLQHSEETLSSRCVLNYAEEPRKKNLTVRIPLSDTRIIVNYAVG